MENYNQSSPKDGNRQSSTMPNQYGRQNQPGNNGNRQQFSEMDDARTTRRGTTSGGYDNPQSSAPNDRPNQHPAQYNAGDNDDLQDDDNLYEDPAEVDDLEDDEEDASTIRQNYSNRRAHGYVSQGIF